ncbi:methionine ABC transporter ATP-binding protein [Ornithinibacillus halotolerans]|uniref:Methionine ABC transporter ATP-binding protein n=1 Tax=Ornithinibacillus halotolerans TaxID=1274357 RepID=A0A916S8B0_9BACI|nr:methionine ABC transporter ATP-binding protein [Ornithinibacillus halotolerans]GGA88638.1 methionine ABC transporter ATP-binding protein [Ornithinibacillus halotolerans]
MISLIDVSKVYNQKDNSTFHAIDSVSLSINRGDIYGIIGRSGAGKSTLLRLINLLEIPSSGTVIVDGEDLTNLSKQKLRHARQSIGMIFQHFNLVSNKTVLENVLVPLELARYPKKERLDRVREVLRFVGLEDLMSKYPSQLSGGQKQRVAIARALANKPKILLCDEPTSALDPNTTKEILEVLQSIHKELDVTIVIVSHEMDLIKSICNRVTIIDNGQVYETVDIKPKGIVNSDHTPDWFLTQLTEERESDNA